MGKKGLEDPVPDKPNPDSIAGRHQSGQDFIDEQRAIIERSVERVIEDLGDEGWKQIPGSPNAVITVSGKHGTWEIHRVGFGLNYMIGVIFRVPDTESTCTKFFEYDPTAAEDQQWVMNDDKVIYVRPAVDELLEKIQGIAPSLIKKWAYLEEAARLAKERDSKW